MSAIMIIVMRIHAIREQKLCQVDPFMSGGLLQTISQDRDGRAVGDVATLIVFPRLSKVPLPIVCMARSSLIDDLCWPA